jgi:S-DNA-T family DNA segregation ATPase FtsK/SpoIIIE
MQLLWFLPSLGFGIYMGLSSGMWQMAVMSGCTGLILGLTMLFRRNSFKPTPEDKVDLGLSGAAIAGRVLPNTLVFCRASWRALLWSEFENQLAARQASANLAALEANGFAVSETMDDGLRACLGFAGDQPLAVDLAEVGPHLLVVGPTGVGKSQFLRLVIRSLRSGHAPNRLALVLVDYKGGSTLGQFRGEPGLLSFVTDLDAAETKTALWQQLLAELEARESLFALTAISNITEYRRQAGDLPRIMVVVDELAAVLAGPPAATAALEAIAARGRSLGVHLICATQSLAGIPRGLLTNLRLRVAIGAVDQIEVAQLGGLTGRAQPKLERRDGWAFGQLISLADETRTFHYPFGLRLNPPTEPRGSVVNPTSIMPEALLADEPPNREPEPPVRLRVRRRGYLARVRVPHLLDRLRPSQA